MFTHRRLLSMAALAGVIAAVGTVLGVIGAFIEVRNNQDLFMDDMRRKAWWLTGAAVAGCIAAMLSAVERVVRLWKHSG
jgi:hypothetical protein